MHILYFIQNQFPDLIHARGGHFSARSLRGGGGRGEIVRLIRCLIGVYLCVTIFQVTKEVGILKLFACEMKRVRRNSNPILPFKLSKTDSVYCIFIRIFEY